MRKVKRGEEDFVCIGNRLAVIGGILHTNTNKFVYFHTNAMFCSKWCVNTCEYCDSIDRWVLVNEFWWSKTVCGCEEGKKLGYRIG